MQGIEWSAYNESMFIRTPFKVLVLAALSLTFSACGNLGGSGGGFASAKSASAVSAGARIDTIATFAVTAPASQTLIGGKDTCAVNTSPTTKTGEYQDLVKVQAVGGSEQITSVQVLSTQNIWETLPVNLTLAAGQDTGWIQLSQFGPRCITEVLIVGSSPTGSATINVFAATEPSKAL